MIFTRVRVLVFVYRYKCECRWYQILFVYVGFSIFLPDRFISVSKQTYIFYLCGYMDFICFAMMVVGKGGWNIPTLPTSTIIGRSQIT